MRRRLGTFLVIALALGLVAMLAHTRRGDETRAVVRPISPKPTPTSVPTSPPSAPSPVELPISSGLQGFVPVGFPHTTLGAEAAAWRWSALTLSLDPDAAAAAARVWAAPSYVSAPVEMAQAALSARANLGLPPTGSPGQAFLVVQPRMVRVVSDAADQPVVDVLVDISAGGPAGATITRVDVIEFYFGWANMLRDWRVLDHPLDAERAAATTAEPQTQEAYSLGWRDASSS